MTEVAASGAVPGQRLADPAVADGLRLFAAVRNRTLEMTRDRTQEELDRRPAPGRWSVGEILDHLLLSELYYRGEFERLIALSRSGEQPLLWRSFSDLDVSMSFIPKALLPLLNIPFTLMTAFTPGALRRILARSRRFRAQNPTLATPRPNRASIELRQELTTSLTATVELFEANPGLDFRRMVYWHPLIGRNTVPELLRFVALHEQRHQDQIEEALRVVRG